MCKFSLIHTMFLLVPVLYIDAQTITITGLALDEDFITVSTRLSSDRVIGVSHQDIIEINNEFINWAGVPIRNFIILYKRLPDNTFQLIITNNLLDEIFYHFGNYLPRSPVPFSHLPMIDFVGEKDINIIIPRQYANISEKRIVSSVKIFFFFSFRSNVEYQLITDEAAYFFCVWDNRTLYWQNEVTPILLR